MPILKVIVLAIVQGLAELLPVSSSAHVVVAEKMMGLDASSPQMTLLLVMLHTGTMFAVIAYFWKTWKFTYFKDSLSFKRFAVRAVFATILTLVIGYPISEIIKKTVFSGVPKAEIEDLFSHLEYVAPALFVAGVLIVIAAAAGPLAERIGPKAVLVPGLALLSAGIAWLSRFPVHGSYLANILGPTVLIGAGLGAAFVAITIGSVSGVTDRQYGLASGLINTSQQIGGAIGLAILTAVASSQVHTTTINLADTNSGYRLALLVAAGIGALATAAATLLTPNHSVTRQAPTHHATRNEGRRQVTA